MCTVQIKLFTDFYQSDIIVASPLAITTRIADDRQDGVDFLSSVEVALVLRADVMLMQNWSHVETVFESLNQMPREQHSTDIMRVRCAARIPILSYVDL
jgi:U3 small nucleolar RNA-associated protein 25